MVSHISASMDYISTVFGDCIIEYHMHHTIQVGKDVEYAGNMVIQPISSNY
uniref:Uncharacterized protein n=1 Tax=Rhizophora mucronata TaxID=61149 RepID=A0A2P2Q739_RHIMU